MTSSLDELRLFLGERAHMNEPLSSHVTLRVGGPAELFVEAKTLDELIEFVCQARRFKVATFVLGNGSNVLVRDGGIKGLVIENHCDKWSILEKDTQNGMLHSESGAALPGIASRLAHQGWAGLEWAIGVPGTIGGAIAGNAGAHGASISDNLSRVLVLDMEGQTRELVKSEMDFEYRSSRFKRKNDEIILSADFEMIRDEPSACLKRMNQYIGHRRNTQPTDPSVGSIFKNPPGDSAGRLIDRAGLKGTQIGGMQVSSVHANFIVNRGNATANDAIRLIEKIRERVLQQFGIELELEIQVIGKAADAGGEP